jgi:hypothetical protein
MVALAQWVVVEGYPLGKPLDGRDRYGMTRQMAGLYRWLVQNRPHDRPFKVNFEERAVIQACYKSNVHREVQQLVERGWLEIDDAGYKFVQPIMSFNPKKGK